MSCYEHITVGVIIIYMSVSVYWPLTVLGVFMCVSVCVCVCVCVFDIKSEYQRKTTLRVRPQ